MAKFIVTFPPELKDEIIENLKEADENVKELNKQKKVKLYTFVLKKAFGVQINEVAMNSWKLLNDHQVLWEFNVLGEDFMKPEKLLALAEKRLKKAFGENISVELYQENKIKKK
jgi:hypothetical protein